MLLTTSPTLDHCKQWIPKTLDGVLQFFFLAWPLPSHNTDKGDNICDNKIGRFESKSRRDALFSSKKSGSHLLYDGHCLTFLVKTFSKNDALEKPRV